METFIKINKLNIKIGSGDKVIHPVKNISFTIKKKEITALIGESGSGKSLTALSIAKLIPPQILKSITGEITYNQKNLIKVNNLEIRKIRANQFSFIFQDPINSLNPTHTIFKQIKEKITISNPHLKNNTLKERILTLLKKVKLTPPAFFIHRFPHELSGGQQQRVMIALALANKNQLLIADEPTTALDVTIQKEILNLLLEIKKEYSLTILFISHDLALVKKLAKKIIVMKEGEIVEQGYRDKIFKTPCHPYTKELFKSSPTPLKKRSLPSQDKRIFLKVNNLKVHYPIKSRFLKRIIGYIKAVDGVSFTIPQGRTLGVIGESGSGKTSLMQSLVRLVPYTGEVFLKEQPLHLLKGLALKKVRKDFQVVFQDPHSSLSPRMSIEEIICEGMNLHFENLDKDQIDEKLKEVLEEVGIPYQDKNRYPHEFSGGQKQRIAIARVIIMKPQLLVLDEPTSSLDISLQKQIIKLLLFLQKKYQLTYLFISHDMRIIRALCDSLIVMKNGQAVEQGETETIFRKPKNPYTKTLIHSALN